jgi:hypothetical protein
MLELVPITLKDAQEFIRKHHRHNMPPIAARFCVGVQVNGELAGVAVAGMPKARKLCLPGNIEIVRTCTTGVMNANSKLYGAILRASAALGYKTAYTYTLQEEPGNSLRASGWVEDRRLEASNGWAANKRGERQSQVNLFGEERAPTGPKIRWRYDLVKSRQIALA